MLVVRGILSVVMVLCGAVIVVRMLGVGLRVETLPGVVLGGAMIALGSHRLSLILRAAQRRVS